MKKYILIVISAILALSAVSCQKTSEGVTEVVNFFQMNGARNIFLGIGDEFTDPGYVEMEHGGTVQTTITNMFGETVNAVTTDQPGYFKIKYHTTNDQGVDLDMVRTVYIYDATVSETLAKGKIIPDECIFFRQNDETGEYEPAGTYAEYAAYYASNGWETTTDITVGIKQIAGNIYTIDDTIGGWYTYVRGYGPYYDFGYDFGFSGYFTLNADMSLSDLSDFFSPAWGEAIEGFQGSYDPEAKKLTIISFWSGMAFQVVVDQN